MLRRISRGGEPKDRAFRAKSFQGRQVVVETADARRLIHGSESALRSGEGLLV